MQTEFVYLQEKQIDTPEYISFYEKFHGAGSFKQRSERIHWYFQFEGYKLLVAIIDGKYVGQSCAYKTTAIVHGKPHEWWWSVDTFALSEMRGKGIGKALKRKLQEECPNFSSASHSAVNGIIKRECGGHEILGYHQFYCPASCYVSLYAELALKKLVGRSIRVPRIRIPYLYGLMNGVNRKIEYCVRELKPCDYDIQLSVFREDCLKDTSFHTQRSVAYLKWKYLQNPSIKYIGLEIINNEQREGVVFFTEVYNGKFTISKAKVSKILDIVIRPGSELTHKYLLSVVMKYFKDRGIAIDGLLTISQSDYWPQIQYPASTPFYMLSTLESPLLKDGYLAFSDHDMEQMYENE